MRRCIVAGGAFGFCRIAPTALVGLALLVAPAMGVRRASQDRQTSPRGDVLHDRGPHVRGGRPAAPIDA